VAASQTMKAQLNETFGSGARDKYYTIIVWVFRCLPLGLYEVNLCLFLKKSEDCRQKSILSFAWHRAPLTHKLRVAGRRSLAHAHVDCRRSPTSKSRDGN
jgi:hypothetical protein